MGQAQTGKEFAAETDIGQVRKKNEDAFLAAPDLQVYAVADGMGGHQAGEVASRIALEVVRQIVEEKGSDEPTDVLQEAAQSANRRVFEESVAREHEQGMGTTLTVLWFADDPNVAYLGHVGDSRCYRFGSDGLQRISKDHSWVQAQIDEGFLTDVEAHTHPMRNVITRSIGFEPKIEADVHRVEFEDGDIFLLASDGLTGKLTDEEIEHFLGAIPPGGELGATVRDLIGLANQRGGEDNITVILVRPPQ